MKPFTRLSGNFERSACVEMRFAWCKRLKKNYTFHNLFLTLWNKNAGWEKYKRLPPENLNQRKQR